MLVSESCVWLCGMHRLRGEGGSGKEGIVMLSLWNKDIKTIQRLGSVFKCEFIKKSYYCMTTERSSLPRCLVPLYGLCF